MWGVNERIDHLKKQPDWLEAKEKWQWIESFVPSCLAIKSIVLLMQSWKSFTGIPS